MMSKFLGLTILTKQVMCAEVPEQGEDGVPAGKKDEHSSRSVQTPKVV